MSSFNFFQHWYPLLPVEDIDPQKLTTATLLGIPLVIWKQPSSKTYQVFLDRCPHRLAPLSEGRIDDKSNNLMCSYHGWQFEANGDCTRIPQADNPEIIAQKNQNFCATVYPSCQKNDLLWVWMDESSAEIAAKTSLPLSSKIDSDKGFVWSSMVRDLEYDWQTLVENVADPSHVPFAHHGIQGNRERAHPIPLNVVQSTIELIKAEVDKPFKTTITFEPPCHLEYEIVLPGGKQLGLITYCIPVAPGKSRIVAQFSRNFAYQLHHLIPRWWDHLQNRNLILDGDMVLLHQQESFLQNINWKTAYKMPTKADRLVIEFHSWLDRYCEGKLPWEQVGVVASLPTGTTSREVLLDRYHQHTQHCSSCRNTLKIVKLWQWILLTYFIVIVSIVAVLPDSLRIDLGVWLTISALLGLGISALLRFWLMPKFYFIDYVHSQR
ncbi:Ring-hydroxylating dioxygenase, large terminal subunit [Hyella patelloides LEGE 07179]|uniref:Ring-hydroxylating dioxygenase, large terminal subunit n=1 Tax=Hyella patelloides LEGE 07179 TaxID=945734 RepID=A0A563W3M6_9CYAN|nr:Rieske 2Fe-2S domain-containing protein [Hyella patelloides]VEP18291.1 Ring-hydroxylating dioxygenase, large terminal subunit [Hyella patelloides LEGE 07179]